MGSVSEQRQPQQISWVDNRLWQWGAWVHDYHDNHVGGSILGRLYKRRMKELRIWDTQTAPARPTPGSDSLMLEVEQAIPKLPKHLRIVIRYRYWYELTRPAMAQRLHRSVATVDRMIVRAQQAIEPYLTYE